MCIQIKNPACSHAMIQRHGITTGPGLKNTKTINNVHFFLLFRTPEKSYF